MEKISMDCTWGTQNLNPKFSVRANNDQAQSIGLDWSTEVDGCFSFVLFLCFIFLRWENIVMTTNAALQSVYSVSCIPVSGFKVPAFKGGSPAHQQRESSFQNEVHPGFCKHHLIINRAVAELHNVCNRFIDRIPVSISLFSSAQGSSFL